MLIMPKTNPATANPAHRVRVFFCTTPTMLNASPAALSSKRKNITVVFQKTLIEQRKINKLTQKQVAEYLGISQPSISAPKNGQSEPTLTNLVKLADLFDVSVDYLLGRTDL